MGLDMHLIAKRYIWRHREEEVLEAVNNLCLVKSHYRPKQIEYEAAYWRKANQIHGWFVANVQDGKDDCEEYVVSLPQLQKLYEACINVAMNHDLAEELLPTGQGFFFGGTDYDDRYFADVQDTVDLLELILSDEDAKHLDFFYQSSW